MFSQTSFGFLVIYLLISSQLSLGAKKKKERPDNLTVGKPAPYNVMNGNPKVDKDDKDSTGGDAPKDAAGKIELMDKQPTGQNTTESGEPPRYPINVESVEAQAHESRITGCRDHPDVVKVCAKAKDPCFCAEHESYMYSYCRKSCKFCSSKMKTYDKFWRLRAASTFNPSWMISKIEFYRARGINTSLSTDANRAYSSSDYDPGFSAGKAFDDDLSTMWMPNGWTAHDDNDDWIAYEFPIPVHVGSLKLNGAIKYPKAAPSKIFVESSNEKYGPFETKWMIRNPNFASEKVFSFIECDVLWQRYETNDEPICFRLITKYKNWMEAQKECQLEGGELASITSKEEHDFIREEVRLCGFTWVGLNDKKDEGQYVWSDGSQSNYTKWKENQVYDEVQRHYEDCVAMDADGNWFTFSCQDKFYFLCKKKLADPADPIVEPPPAPETPPIQFVAPNFTVPVVGIEVKDEEEDQSAKEKHEELLAAISMSRMKELGLKPPEAVANLDVPPSDLGEQLHNLTEIAIKNSNASKINADIEKEQKLVPPPPGRQRPKLKHGGSHSSSSKGITVLKVPTSAGQELIDEIPGVPNLRLPGSEKNGSNSNGNKNNNNKEKEDSESEESSEPEKQEKPTPPPAQEGQPEDSELSVGESGDEGPAVGQGDGQRPNEQPIKPPQPNAKPKKQKKKPKGPILATPEPTQQDQSPEYPPQLKNPSMPTLPPTPKQKLFAKLAGKKHGKENKKSKPFSIKFAGKQITNFQDKDSVNFNKLKAKTDLGSEEIKENIQGHSNEDEDSEDKENHEVVADTNEDTENDVSGDSGSSIAGFDPDLEEEFLDLDVNDLF